MRKSYGSRPVRPSAYRMSTVRPSRSSPVTSASSMSTLRCRRNTWRRGGAIWPSAVAGRHLVEQRLKQVVRGPVDQRHRDRRPPEGLDRPEPGEPAPDHHHARSLPSRAGARIRLIDSMPEPSLGDPVRTRTSFTVRRRRSRAPAAWATIRPWPWDDGREVGAMRAKRPVGVAILLVALVGCGSSADVSPEDLEGSTWTVVEGMNVDVPDGATPTAEFAQGQLSGFRVATSTRRRTRWTATDDPLGEVAGTLIACDEATTAVETDYLASLSPFGPGRSRTTICSCRTRTGTSCSRYRCPESRDSHSGTSSDGRPDLRLTPALSNEPSRAGR